MINRLIICMWLSLFVSSMGIAANNDHGWWWPTQKVPKGIVRAYCKDETDEIAKNQLPLQMLTISVAGLAAKAVNEGNCDDLIWIDTAGHKDCEDWLARLMNRLDLKIVGDYSTWPLVNKYKDLGIIKGYILYRTDDSAGGLFEHRQGMNLSVNVATSMAGLLDGILIDETLETKAKAHGLKMLFDARDVSQKECYDKYRDEFSRTMLCTQDPKVFNIRDLAIASKAFTVYGYDSPTTEAMEHLKPLSPILGWNGGDENKTTMMSSIYGHIQTATNWCMNLPVLMAGADKYKPARFSDLSPNDLDWKDNRSAVSFVMSDGDNVQWFMIGFARGQEPSWWTSPDRGKIPFAWSECFSNLLQLCPDAIDYYKETQTPNDWFIEWGGGYYYPDAFGRARSNPKELLADHVRRTWDLMKINNIKAIGFNFNDLESKEAHEAYEIIAKEMDGLLGVFAFQYAPYEAGAGKVFWVKDKKRRLVPIVTDRYGIWANASDKPMIGTPAKVASDIVKSVEMNIPNQLPRYDWVIVHCWSYFKKTDSNDPIAEDMPQADAPANGGIRGYSPALWCAERLPQSIRVVNPYELLWRIKMQHNPYQTIAEIKSFK